MRLRTLLTGVQAMGSGSREVEITGISYDTRTLQKGDLYLALRGYKTDGHKYIEEARTKGARAILCEEGCEIQGTDIFTVPDSRAALAVVSANWFGHPAKALTLVGVTGTNGKTTVTTFIKHILEETLQTKVGLIGTNGNQIGAELFPASRTTPESWEIQNLLRQMADANCTHVVMEVSSHALCCHRVDGLFFRAGAFTNLTPEHLDFHKTMEAYREAKGRLFQQSGTAVLNLDDAAGRFYAQSVSIPVLTYSKEEQRKHMEKPADLQAETLQFFPQAVSFHAKTHSESCPVFLPVPGGFTVSNALCALGCAQVLGIPLSAAAESLKKAPPVKGRMEVVPTPGPGTVLIDYAHTPDALENTLKTLREFTEGRLICLFGCGGDRDRTKRPIMGAIAGRLSDIVIVTSDNPRTEPPEAILENILSGLKDLDTPRLVEPDRRKAIQKALQMLQEKDTLLLAGKGHETYQEKDGKKLHLDEREEIARFFNRQNPNLQESSRQ